MASGAFPFLADVPPMTFLKALAVAEIGVGVAVVLAPFVPNRLAGASLTAFAGSLVTMYLRTPRLHEPGSIWPTPAGIGVSKDVWMLGIGAGPPGGPRRGTTLTGRRALATSCPCRA